MTKYAFVQILAMFLILPSYIGCSHVDGNTAQEAYYQIEGNVFDPSQLRQAAIKLERARKAYPNDPWVYMTESLATLVSGYKIGDWYKLNTFTEGSVDRALDLAKMAVELGPNESQAYAHLARIYIIKRKYKTAWSLLNEAHERSPESFYPWYFRGIISEQMRDATRATWYFDEADKCAKYDYQREIVNIHRQAVAKFTGNLGGQERLLKENIDRNPSNPYGYGNYASFLMKQKRYDEAIDNWERAIRIAPYPHAVEQLEEAKRLKQSNG